jgi:hypothetical protein
VEFRDGFSGSWTTQSLTDFEADGYRISRLSASFPGGQNAGFGTVFPAGARNVRATYKGGYESAPDDVKQAIKELVETWFRARVTTGGGQISFRDASAELPSTPRTVEQIINLYKRLPGT